MPISEAEQKNVSASTTFRPYAGVRAEYSDTSFFEANFHRDKGEVSFADIAAAHRAIVDYVSTKLSGWANSNTATKPTSYRVYLSVSATYKDGRQANRYATWMSCKSLDGALKHTDQSTKKLLVELDRIGKDDV